MAHEVRTPLGSIQGSAEILAEDFPEDHPKRPFFEILMQEIARLNHVIQDFLDLGRPMVVAPTELDAASVVEDCFTSLKGLAEQQGVKLSASADRGEAIFADPARLHQALTNLVRNAIQASPQGGTVRVAARAQSEGSLITVEDDGPGLPADEQHHLFEPFFTRRKDGTGLGLALIKQIAQSHGGWVRGENRHEASARFSLWLPLRKGIK